MNSKSNREKFKAMTRKQKMEYIWEYYKWHFIVTIAAILLIAEIINLATRPRPHYDAHVIVTGQMTLDDQKMSLDEERIRQDINADIYYLPGNWGVEDSTTVLNEQVLTLRMQVGEADILIMSKDRYERFMNIEAFEPLVRLEEVPQMQDLLEKYEDKLIKGVGVEDGKEHVYGIPIETIHHMEAATLYDEYMIALIRPTKNIDKAVETVRYLMGE